MAYFADDIITVMEFGGWLKNNRNYHFCVFPQSREE